MLFLVQEHIQSDCTLNPDIKGMSSPISTDSPTEVKFVLSDNLKSEIKSAINYHNEQINGLEVSFGQNFEVNRSWMTSRNLGADGFLQLSLQIAHRLLHGKKPLWLSSYHHISGYQCATYESASTCAFQHGRTETIRPCTHEAVELAKFYVNADFNNVEDCREIDRLLRKAIKVHNKKFLDDHIHIWIWVEENKDSCDKLMSWEDAIDCIERCIEEPIQWEPEKIMSCQGQHADDHHDCTGFSRSVVMQWKNFGDLSLGAVQADYRPKYNVTVYENKVVWHDWNWSNYPVFEFIWFDDLIFIRLLV